MEGTDTYQHFCHHMKMTNHGTFTVVGVPRSTTHPVLYRPNSIFRGQPSSAHPVRIRCQEEDLAKAIALIRESLDLRFSRSWPVSDDGYCWRARM
jgi:hypothetical protein